MKVFFRVDGGDIYSVAMGHIYRCAKTAEALRGLTDAPLVFIMKNHAEGVKKIAELGFETLLLDRSCSVKDDVKTIVSWTKGECLVTDVRHYTEDDFRTIKTAVSLLAVFDDLGSNQFAPHLLINPSVLPAHMWYDRLFADRYLTGPAYFNLGSEVIPRRDAGQRVEKIVVSLGGADPAGYTAELAKKALSISEKFEFTFVLGPAYADPAGFSALLKELGFKAEVLHNVKKLPAFFTRYDLAVVSGGDTCLELAYTGVSGMVIPTIGYEAEIAEYMQASEVFPNLGDVKKKTAEEVVNAICGFAGDYPRRKRFSENVKRLIDGQGGSRVARALMEEMEKRMKEKV